MTNLLRKRDTTFARWPQGREKEEEEKEETRVKERQLPVRFGTKRLSPLLFLRGVERGVKLVRILLLLAT